MTKWFVVLALILLFPQGAGANHRPIEELLERSNPTVQGYATVEVDAHPTAGPALTSCIHRMRSASALTRREWRRLQRLGAERDDCSVKKKNSST